MNNNAQFLKNIWYLSAWETELGDGSLARTIADVPLLFLRTDDGVSALLDRCPHRFAPLSCGQVKTDHVVCGYHGLAFGADGKCVSNPHGPIVSALQVPTFPAVLRHAAVWVWLGDREAADPALIPDMHFIDRAGPAARVEGHLENEAHYMLMVENIMDLSHADYLHATTLGNGINTIAKTKVEVGERSITVRWSADDHVLPPVQDAVMPRPGQPAFFRNDVEWSAPGAMVQTMIFGPADQPEQIVGDSVTAHVMTPMSATRTHYFFCHTSNLVSAQPEMVPQIREILLGAFAGEDSPMLAAQQTRIGSADFWDLGPVLLPSDVAAVRVRRRMDQLLAAERGDSVEQPA
ncbi:aromatic ring-hydroxylating dioxygenase subunit alpha [Sphingobium sp. HBC34]|uniref:Aromatic ring-hydroxylating dioxygenase subunit alpha n=1 Tax=Sphingobium cyanobacteriorum TaxID=3063954 RepID=A0ABT8ZNN5_9SPHN|nr:aromatic ring-hydroxylating dioxygenase subunit alpha [Sphingobium sp. HBC34]MDO7836144.1 aromatic ring-hydroxylating dioxygenase subunit alpha [Sphingobium sp. HBC34]